MICVWGNLPLQMDGGRKEPPGFSFPSNCRHCVKHLFLLPDLICTTNGWKILWGTDRMRKLKVRGSDRSWSEVKKQQSQNFVCLPPLSLTPGWLLEKKGSGNLPFSLQLKIEGSLSDSFTRNHRIWRVTPRELENGDQSCHITLKMNKALPKSLACMGGVEYVRSNDFLIKLSDLIHPFQGTLYQWVLNQKLSDEQMRYCNIKWSYCYAKIHIFHI